MFNHLICRLSLDLVFKVRVMRGSVVGVLAPHLFPETMT